MIWHRGEIVKDEAVCVSVLDRTFEHGLGLFETFRTWNGHPTLLSKHLDRLERSASELGLPLVPADLPDAAAVRALVEANGIAGDARIRITMSGGCASGVGALAWMMAAPLPSLDRARGLVVDGAMVVAGSDPLAPFKTLNYWRNGLTHARAVAANVDDVLCVTTDGWVCETTRYNLFVVESGRLVTPSTDLPMLPGVMRGVVLEHAERLGIETEETRIAIGGLQSISEAFLTNSVRGIMPVSRLLGRELEAPGLVTRRLWEGIEAWLEAEA